MLTDTELKKLKQTEKTYKVADRDGMYVSVATSGTKSFRYDYRINGRRETLTIGRYDENLSSKVARGLEDLEYGISLTLAEARMLLADARRSVEKGESPSRAKAEKRTQIAESLTFGSWAERYFTDKADPDNGARLADSTLAMRRSIYNRDLVGPFGKLKLEEITVAALMALCEKVKARGAPAPAIQVREIVLLVFRFAHTKDKTLDLKNPAESIKPSDIATFKPRERALSPAEIRQFFLALDETATSPTLRLAVKFVLLTMVRKGEFVGGTWTEVDFEAGTWTIPATRMKAKKPLVVYLSQQALDILVTFKTCFESSKYLHPSRYDLKLPISDATLNRVIDAAVKHTSAGASKLASFSVHDLRRTASSLLNEAGFNRDWIEKCLAHEESDVRSIYNKAEYGEQRRVMLQAWADMVDAWIRGESVREIVRTARMTAADVAMEFS
ncbi:MAG: tyrosine-type recombinase/integrase [Burkholderiales bacterium]|nr:tyrosine-type recombinase/integrase [Burkholderiales bacterium]